MLCLFLIVLTLLLYRFSIYGYWHNDFYKKSLELKTLKTKMEKETKGLVGLVYSYLVWMVLPRLWLTIASSN
jgi:hypothetical protein